MDYVFQRHLLYSMYSKRYEICKEKTQQNVVKKIEPQYIVFVIAKNIQLSGLSHRIFA